MKSTKQFLPQATFVHKRISDTTDFDDTDFEFSDTEEESPRMSMSSVSRRISLAFCLLTRFLVSLAMTATRRFPPRTCPLQTMLQGNHSRGSSTRELKALQALTYSETRYFLPAPSRQRKLTYTLRNHLSELILPNPTPRPLALSFSSLNQRLRLPTLGTNSLIQRPRLRIHETTSLNQRRRLPACGTNSLHAPPRLTQPYSLMSHMCRKVRSEAGHRAKSPTGCSSLATMTP